MERKDRVKAQKVASIVGIIGNAILALAKLIVGFLTQSMAVIGDGIDSASDIITSLISLFTAFIASKPPDQEHPYGHERAETIATKLLSFTIAFAGFQLLISTIKQIFSGENIEIPGIAALYVTGVSIVGKFFLAFYKGYVGRRIDSKMLMADAKNMRNDILLSASVLVGVGLTQWLKLPILDRLLALFISFFIIKVGIEIFLETSAELMDGLDDLDIYKKVFCAVKEVQGAHNPHRTRIRRMNTQLVVDIDIEVNASLTIKEGHAIANRVEKNIKKHLPDVYDVLVHMEPLGVIHGSESYGLKEEDFS